MLARSAWQEVLAQAGFVNELAWPTQESSPLRQHLLVARSPGVNRPDKAAVRRYLQQRFGSGLPALRIRQQEALLAPLRTPSVAQIAPAESTPVAGAIRRWKNRSLNSGNRCFLAPWPDITTFCAGRRQSDGDKDGRAAEPQRNCQRQPSGSVHPFNAQRLLRPSAGLFVGRGGQSCARLPRRG